MHIMTFVFQVVGSSVVATALLGGTVKLMHLAQTKAIITAASKFFLR